MPDDRSRPYDWNSITVNASRNLCHGISLKQATAKDHVTELEEQKTLVWRCTALKLPWTSHDKTWWNLGEAQIYACRWWFISPSMSQQSIWGAENITHFMRVCFIELLWIKSCKWCMWWHRGNSKHQVCASWNYFESGHGKGPCDRIGATKISV